VLDCGAITDIDYSAAGSLRDLLEDLAAADVKVTLGRVSAYLREDLDRHSITPVIGIARICANLHQAIRLAQDGVTPGAER
jgi:anti-anti-sigma regulatory factor